jgi:hypothetical protein|tara:strand:- start:106 stop:381 length:276 start_codon:yes stop_codon:yes gene_type:complete
MQTKLQSSMIQFAKVPVGYVISPTGPTKLMQENKMEDNKNLTYWWNLPIDELEEMADENGKIKLERTNMSKKEMKANILKNIEEDNEYFNK